MCVVCKSSFLQKRLGFLFVLRCGRNVESTGRRPGNLTGASAGLAMDSHVTCKLQVKDSKEQDPMTHTALCTLADEFQVILG